MQVTIPDELHRFLDDDDQWDFLQQTAAAGIPYCRYAPGELARELESLRKLDETVD